MTETQSLHDEIRSLARTKNAVILAHNYQVPDIQDVADYVGDSLYLSRIAAQTEADTIIFCGVHFMAETAKLLSPNKRVLIPDSNAGCSLADTITADQLRQWKSEYPGAIVVAYVNTTAAVKAESDICCTSSNAVDVVNIIDLDREILFLPDQFLGAHVQRITGRENMHIWMGECHVHAGITPADIKQTMNEHPHAELLVHPECGCTTSVVYLATVGDLPADRTRIVSTGGMVDFAKATKAKEALVATEVGIIHQLERVNKKTKFLPVNPEATWEFMKMITMEKLLRSLREDVEEVDIPADVAERARRSVESMIEIGSSVVGAE